MRHDLDNRIGTYVGVLDGLGPDVTALAVMLTAKRQARGATRGTAGTYFAGMVGKARRDEPGIDRSL